MGGNTGSDPHLSMGRKGERFSPAAAPQVSRALSAAAGPGRALFKGPNGGFCAVSECIISHLDSAGLSLLKQPCLPTHLMGCLNAPPPSLRSFCMFRFYTMIRLFVLLLSVHSKRSKTNTCRGRDASSLVTAAALMERNSRSLELLLRLLLL